MLKAMTALSLMIPLLAASGANQRPLPEGFKWGRCLLEVDGKTYISGPCAYYRSVTGDFEIHGPNQIWSGIDYPKPEIFSHERSTDYFAQVSLDGGKTAYGVWNRDKRATHAHTDLGRLERKGACWINRKVRVCAWE